ncbi:uncharacterized protein LOC112562942 isoform X2 [Pomacea canaliculata]|uniref:uncharacterized protein LOC112562942 isoform X2 n=1 Tax=Pomacea canaliculata TaxID=400727 RepID=UPI000D73A7CE|nr:uncharacterized protein LOC112562942 isoform X2 [Pomacea canaliculata]
MTGIPGYAVFLCYWLQLLENVSASNVPLGPDVGLAGHLPNVAAVVGPTDRRHQSDSCQLAASFKGGPVSPSSALVEYSLTYVHDDMEVPANDSLKGPLFSSPDVVFRGDHWVRVTSSAGRSLLHLDDNYRVLSLGTLSIRTTHVTITVSDVPEGCLMERSEEDRKRSIRILLLNSSSTNSGVYVTGADKLVEVCNLEATRGSRNEAQFEYVCCSMTSPLEESRAEPGVNESSKDVHLVCYTLTHSQWSHLLTAGIWGLKVLVILFTPLLIPRNLFGEGFASETFSYQLPKRNDHQLPETTGASDQTLSLTLTVVKETATPRILKCGSLSKGLPPKLYVDKMEGEEMVHFLNFLDGKGIQRNIMYEVDVDTVMFSIKRRKLLTRWEIPVGFFQLFYDQVLRCHVRHATGLTACCEANICGESDDNRDNAYKSSYIPWYKLCRLLARLLFLCTLTLPWVLRMMFYYVYEQHLEEDKKRAADRLGVTYSFSGSLALYLTPGHDVFLVLYGMSFTFILAYEIFDSSFRRDVKKILLASMRDLYSERAKKGQGGQSKLLRKVLSPVRRRGIYGLPMLCVASPLVVLYLAYYLFPSVNLTVRLLAHLGN